MVQSIWPGEGETDIILGPHFVFYVPGYFLLNCVRRYHERGYVRGYVRGYTGTRVIFGGRTELHRSFRWGIEPRTEYRTLGIVIEGVPVPGVYLGGRTELTEVSGTGIEINTELTELPGTGIEFVPNLPKCRVPISSSYRTIPECSVG